MNDDNPARGAHFGRRCAMPNLTAEDLARHQALGIPPELLEQAGVVRVTDADARALLCSRHSGDLAGVVYPYRDPATGAGRAKSVNAHPGD